MRKENFEKIVQEALDGLPKKFKRYLDNIAVIVETKPSRDVYEKTGGSPFSSILGLYHGVPLKHRGPYYGNLPPDVIIIYQEPIEQFSSSEEDIRKKVQEVVLHEIGHFFGLSDKELKEIEKL